jgi:hypothetical protein
VLTAGLTAIGWEMAAPAYSLRAVTGAGGLVSPEDGAASSAALGWSAAALPTLVALAVAFLRRTSRSESQNGGARPVCQHRAGAYIP